MRKTLYLTAFVLAAACTQAPVAVTPPAMGWSSWNAFMTDISDTLIMQQADLMVSTGLAAAGYDHINIDDGYFGPRDENGRMTENPERFPGGMKPVVDHIHSLSLKAGIYSDAGDNTCGSGYNDDFYGFGAGFWGHEAQDAQVYFNDWNFDFIKIDFCGGNHLKLDTKERYLRIREVIDSVSTHPVEVNICRWHYPGTWVNEAGNSWRISGDIAPEWPFVTYIMRMNMYLSAYAGGGRYNDMDMLVVGYAGRPSMLRRGNGMTFAEEEAHFGLWCIMSSPLMIGCDLAYLPEDTRTLITNPELIAVNQDPLGLQPYVVQHEGSGYVFVKDIKTLRGLERAVALYNPSEEAVLFEVPADILGFKGEIALRDLVRREDLGSSPGIRMEVPAHYARILSVKGGKRIEDSVYEAEWGYIPAFNDIGLGGAKYVQMEGASCGAVVKGLGGSEDNCLQWRTLHRRRGGKHTLEVRYRSDVDCKAVLAVNGVAQDIELKANSGYSEAAAEVRFKKGDNFVEISSPSGDFPAVIDCIRISR